MADEQPKRRKPPVFKAATIAHVKVPKVELSDSTIEEVISILGVEDEGWVRALRTVLPKQAQAYMLAKVIVNADSPHRSKKAVARMAAGLSTALEAMGEIGIEQTMALAILLEKSEGAAAQRSLIEIRNIIENVRDTAVSWIDRYKPSDRRPRNRALEAHVGALMWFFELITGNRASSSLKRGGSHAPRLTSPEARAIGKFLGAVDRTVTETAVANKIVQICKERKGKSLGYYAPVMLAGAPVYAVP